MLQGMSRGKRESHRNCQKNVHEAKNPSLIRKGENIRAIIRFFGGSKMATETAVKVFKFEELTQLNPSLAKGINEVCTRNPMGQGGAIAAKYLDYVGDVIGAFDAAESALPPEVYAAFLHSHISLVGMGGNDNVTAQKFPLKNDVTLADVLKFAEDMKDCLSMYESAFELISDTGVAKTESGWSNKLIGMFAPAPVEASKK